MNILKKTDKKRINRPDPVSGIRPFRRANMVFQLWIIMMGLVLFAIAFMWVVQIFLFEQNYAETTLSEAKDRLEPLMKDLQNKDISDDDRFLPFLSHVTDGNLLLIGNNGQLLSIYTYGHEIKEPSKGPEHFIWEGIKNSKEFDDILNQTPFQKVNRVGGRVVSVEIGIPVTFAGKAGYLVVHHSINLHTVLNLNRRELIILSIFLTLAAAVLAAVCSRHFTKPIYAIKDTIDRLAKNDFSAKPEVDRQDEFGQLADSVELLGQALSRVDLLRKEVIANVSHELRSPLAVISGYAEMVRDIDWKDEKKRVEDLNLIIHESRRMSEMVNDILDYSQLQSGYIRLNMVPCNLCELAETETFHCAAKAAEHKIRLNFESEPNELFLMADPLKLSQVLRNLLYNAINHTPEGGLITIRLAKQTDGFRLSVSNPGDPIPEEDRRIIWERYQRSQHQSGRHLGTGIGLSIVSTILNAHKMSYGVDCEDGQTIFWFDCLDCPAADPEMMPEEM